MGCLILRCSGVVYKNATPKKGFDKRQDAAYCWSFMCLLKNLYHEDCKKKCANLNNFSKDVHKGKMTINKQGPCPEGRCHCPGPTKLPFHPSCCSLGICQSHDRGKCLEFCARELKHFFDFMRDLCRGTLFSIFPKNIDQVKLPVTQNPSKNITLWCSVDFSLTYPTCLCVYYFHPTIQQTSFAPSIPLRWV